MTVDTKRNFIINTIFWILVILVAYLIFRYLAVWTLPFLIGFLIAYMLRPIVRFFTKRLHFRPKVAATFAAILFYAGIGTLLWLLILYLSSQIGNWIAALPTLYNESIEPLFRTANDWVVKFLSGFSPAVSEEAASFLTTISAGIQSFLTSLSGKFLSGVTHLARGIPLFFVATVFTILSSILICVDFERIRDFIKNQIPKGVLPAFLDVKNFLYNTVFQFLKAYLIIMLITFFEIALGLWLLKVDYFPAIAALVAVVDVLPILGSGTVLIPWAIFELIQKNYFLGFGILVLYGIVTLVRSIMEPKIVGDHVGLEPIITITAMYFGLNLMGVGGMFFAIFLVLVLKYLHDSGRIVLYRGKENEK